ncbi:MAG: hypothetical protein IJX67_09005 [Oscillospiraceae bacterium]|nr:hypothetical protein [Oscillospiraceae bacterium]
MKKSRKKLQHILAMAFVIICLFSMAVPAAATETNTAPGDTTYGIAITCSYFDMDEADTADRSIYTENVFRLSSKTSSLYAIAEYREETQSYHVTGYTDSKDNATHLRCGTDGKLRISGLIPDTYILDQIQTSAGYSLAFDTELDFSSTTATVNGSEMDTSIDPDTAEVIAALPIQLVKEFDLPMMEPINIPLIITCVIVELCCIIELIIILIHWRKEKKSEENQIGG